jgi:hypothetical protein
MPSTPRAAAYASRATCSHTCVKVNSSRTGKRGYCVLAGVKRRTDVCPRLRSFETTIANHGESPLFPVRRRRHARRGRVRQRLDRRRCWSNLADTSSRPWAPFPTEAVVASGANWSWWPTGGGSGAFTGLEGSFNTSGDAITAVLAPVRRMFQARLRAPSICRNAKRARGSDALTAAERTSH